ncbi:hypothetical protein ISG33_08645 [Glaciecola sp. MH2013]|uniref:hypothetical protein n=1 Tax=Glaciecola sp. MH2013 TaxID=2785524 RepID=UPI00189F2B38|nr:hypothetical protein [Glaciecola sp. MH2013]MBF7073461.1 hypothetical protein [Glaciecola sp. MH2013]
MTRFSDFTKYIPPEFLAAANLASLILKIEEYEQKVRAIETQLDDAKKIFDALLVVKKNATALLKDPSLQGLGSFLTSTKAQMTNLQLQGDDNLTTTSEFADALRNVARAEKLHETFTRLVQPIGSQSPISKAIDADDSVTVPLEQLKVAIKVDAEASYSISVLNHEQAIAFLGQATDASSTDAGIDGKDVLINRDLRAELQIGGKASIALDLLRFSAGGSVLGAVELDSYYQISSVIPSYRALWEMHADNFEPWDLVSARASLQNTNAQGYRAFAIRSKRAFSAWGKVELGESLTNDVDLASNEITLKLSAKASYSRKYEFDGVASLKVHKNSQNQLVVKVDFEEESSLSSALAFKAQAQVKGVDRMAQRYADMILGQGNKFIAFLEQFSQPGQSIINQVVSSFDKDAWYQPFAKLVLGQSSSDELIDELLLEQLQDAVDREVFSLQKPPEELALLAFREVLARFSINIDDFDLPPIIIIDEPREPLPDDGSEEDEDDSRDESANDKEDRVDPPRAAPVIPLPPIREPSPIDDPAISPIEEEVPVADLSLKQSILRALVYRLALVIRDVQSDMRAQVQGFVDEIKDAVRRDAKEELAPLQALGDGVAQAISNIDKEPKALFDLVLTNYQQFTDKLAVAVEKSENIKLALALSQTEQDSETLGTSFEVTFLSESLAAQLLYQYLLLGLDEKADLLLQSLEASKEVELSARALRLDSKMQRTTTQSLSLLGFSIQSRKVDVSKVSIEVDAEGAISVKNSVRVTDSASSKYEKRRAAASLTYKFAQSAMQNKASSAFSFSYVNQNNTLHSPNDIKRLLGSFSYSDEHLSRFENDVPNILSRTQVATALLNYQKHFTRFSSSELIIKMRGGKKIYNALIALQADDIFQSAVDFLLTSYPSKDRKTYIYSALNFYKLRALTQGNDDWDYRAFFDEVSTHSDGLSIEPNTFYSRFMKTARGDQHVDLQLWTDANPDSILQGAKTFKAAMRVMSKIGKEANALANLPAYLSDIDSKVAAFKSDVESKPEDKKHEALNSLNRELKAINEKVTEAISPWIDVDSVLKDFVEDLLGKNDINYKLVSFMLMMAGLLAAEHKKKPLFRVVIKLEKEGKMPKLIVV